MLRALGSLSTYERAFLIAFLWAMIVTGATSCASAPRPPRSRPVVEMDATLYPNLLDALLHYRPHLLSSRGYPLLLVVNGGLAEPLENLALIQTAWVLSVVRLNHDVRQVGNVATLHVTLRSPE